MNCIISGISAQDTQKQNATRNPFPCAGISFRMAVGNN